MYNYRYKFKKVKLALAFLSLFILINMVQKTYMKYNSSASGEAIFDVARWQITVNNQDIIESSSISNVITPTILENPHTKSGKVAPLSKGYFDIVIDYTNVETSFEYSIKPDLNFNKNVEDFKITGYSVNGGELNTVNDEIAILERIYLNNPERVKTIRIYISWYDGEEETMDNAADTNATLQNKKANLNILLNFKQIAE